MVLKRFFVILFLFKAPLAWGFSVERTESYVRRAQTLELFRDPQWLRLGHYHPAWTSSYKSGIRGDFFLAPSGARDPRVELETTLRHLFSDEGSRLQCRYLARMRWLKKVLPLAPEDVVSCPERDAWKKKLNAQEIYFIFAANDLSSAASSFGHTFLRLHDPAHVGKLDLIDYGVNFSAQTDDSDGALFALKGLFGFYPGFYSMMPFHQKMREYTNLEGRDLWEYRLNLNPDQVAMLVDHLLELEGSYVFYYFLDNNCSYQLLELLEVARPDLSLTSSFHDATIPLDTLKVLNENHLLGAETRRPSLKRAFEFKFHALDPARKDQVVGLARKMDRAETPPDLQTQDAEVLESALAYADLQSYSGKGDLKEWRYRLALARSTRGALEEKAPPQVGSPLRAAAAVAWQIGFFRRQEVNFGEFKFRRAYHDLLSRDEGVAPFTHFEVLSFALQKPLDEGPLDLRELKLLKIISTLPVNRLDHPLSWKVDIGTEDKLNLRLEGGAGWSFDFDEGQGGRWIHLLVGRAFRERESDYIGAGVESLFVQKFTDHLRGLAGARALAVARRGPLWESEIAVSYDLNSKLETRLSVERIRGQSEFHWRLIF